MDDGVVTHYFAKVKADLEDIVVFAIESRLSWIDILCIQDPIVLVTLCPPPFSPPLPLAHPTTCLSHIINL